MAITYSTGQCSFAYGGPWEGQQCPWNGRLLNGLCAEHHLEARQLARVKQPTKPLLGSPSPARRYIGDPSAPWCTCHGGCDCEKPKWAEWWDGVKARGR